MIVGNPSILAIESEITQAYSEPSLRGLGLFVIHVGGHRYGVYSPDATMLANSFNSVERRIANRGRHAAPFVAEPEPEKIVAAVVTAIYRDAYNESYFGIPARDFVNLIYSNDLLWAPDGDEAFDDGSCVLQFDDQDCVRVIAFTKNGGGDPDPATIRDVRLSAGDYYSILQLWRDRFDAQWITAGKIANL
jgi:hypothetical protein